MEVVLPVQEPPLPLALRLKIGSLYSTKHKDGDIGRILVSHLGSHSCGMPVAECHEPFCYSYLNWFLRHYHGCQQRDSCSSCIKLMEWVSLHSWDCPGVASCPLGVLCAEAKKRSLKRLMTSKFGPMEGLNPNGHHGNSFESLGMGYLERTDETGHSGRTNHYGMQNGSLNNNYSTNNGNYAHGNERFNGTRIAQAPLMQNGYGNNHHLDGMGGRFPLSRDLQSRQLPSSGFTDRARDYEQQYSSSAPDHTNSISLQCSSSSGNTSSCIQDVRAGAEGLVLRSGEADNLPADPDMKAFQRTMSVCSSMSIRDVLQQFGGNLTDEQASLAIRCMVASRRSSGAPSESMSSYSFGDGISSRQNSVDPNSNIGKSYRQSESVESNFYVSSSSAESQDGDSGERKVRKRSSQNKLVHMHHVEESVEAFEATPPQHTPVQRSETGESNTRVLVNGSCNGTMTMDYSCAKDSSGDSSDERSSSGGLEGFCESKPHHSNGGRILYPVQREDSDAENGSRDKLLLTPGRGSISVANLKHLKNIDLIRQYNLSSNKQVPIDSSSLSSALPSRLGGEDHYRSNRILTTSSSSGYSPDSSQPNSLEGSTSEGDERGKTWAGLNPEESLSTLLLSRSPPQSICPPAGGDFTSVEPMSWNSKCTSNSSSGTILNQSSEPTSPNFCSSGTTVNDNQSIPGRCNQPYLAGDDHYHTSSAEFNSQNVGLVEGYIVEDKNFGEYNNGSKKELDPHIFANFSDSEASVSFTSSHAHQPSLSDSDYETKPHLQRALVEHVQEDFEGICDRIDEIQERHRDDLEVMRSRRKIMAQQHPLLSHEEGIRRTEPKVPSESWSKDGDVPLDDEEDHPPLFYERELDVYKDSLTPVNPDKVAVEEVNHREKLREYLMGQFHCQRVYREGLHWERGHPLGRGGQATCYSILDKTTRLSLVLKEELENDKSLDEAYVCLKLAYEFNVSRNIVEYFSAALLPSYRLSSSYRLSPNIVQLFMEIMPTNMQSYLYRNGPLPMTDVHHFAFQLFDALEFLHNRERIIHCDIKPANLLVDYTAQHLKLADFGAAELLDKRQTLGDRAGSNCGGTLHYIPPEYHSQGGDCSFALDQWQAGCCVMAMCTGRRPWRHLYMDPTHQRTPPTSDVPLSSVKFSNLKKFYASMIGQEKNGHMIPGFVDSCISKLLHGCLNPEPSMRLTAMDSRQLLAFSEEMSDAQRTTVLDAIGCPVTVPKVLLSIDDDLPRVDVFLGSHYKKVMCQDHPHTLYPGWLGSLPYRQGLSYEDLPFTSAFPVLSHLSPLDVGLWDGSPQEFFVATVATNSNHHSGQNRHFVRIKNLKQPVDPSKFIVLFQSHHSGFTFQ